MNDFFNFNQRTTQLELSQPEILLIQEFKALLDNKRNKCKEDPKGEDKLRAYREFTYIYLALHWKSPYADYIERDRHDCAIQDSGLTEDEFNDPIFRAACRKFKQLQESHRSIRLMKAAQVMADKFIEYFMNVDPEERDPVTGKPIFQVEKLQTQISNLSKVHEQLTILESQVKKELQEVSQIRGGAVEGFLPDL